MDSTQQGGHGFSSSISLSKARSASIILVFMSIFLAEFSVNFVKSFGENKKRKALTMQLALYSNDKKIYCELRVTFKATQPYINPIIINYYYFCVYLY